MTRIEAGARLNQSHLLDWVDQVIDEALTSVRSFYTDSIMVRRTSPRYRSCSNHRSDESMSMALAFPRCSLPSTTTDLLTGRSRRSSRLRHVQYSFSLNRSRVNDRRLNSVKNFAQELVNQTIRSALTQLEHVTAVQTFADRCAQSILRQSFEDVFASSIRSLTTSLVDDIVSDALTIVAEQNILSRSIQIDYGIYPTKVKTCPVDTIAPPTISNEHVIQSMINGVAQSIYSCSIAQLRE
jgi:hypothetical protein